MKYKELTKKLALLKDGLIVDIEGLPFSARKVDKDKGLLPCDCCNVDCLCRGDVAEICTNLDLTWYLYLEC